MNTLELINNLKVAMADGNKKIILEICQKLKSNSHSRKFQETGQKEKKWLEHLANIEINAKHPKQYVYKAESSVLSLTDGLQ